MTRMVKPGGAFIPVPCSTPGREVDIAGFHTGIFR